MTSSTKPRWTWQRVVSIIFLAPILFIMMERIGYDFGPRTTSLTSGLSTPVCAAICAILGAIAGMLFNNPSEPFSHLLAVRGIAGFITGGLAIYAFQAYVALRGYPEKLMRIEMVVALVIAAIPGIIIYRLAGGAIKKP